MKSFKEFITEAKDLESGDMIVATDTTKVKSGVGIRDGVEYTVRVVNRDDITIRPDSGNSKKEFKITWNEYSKYFD